MGEAVLLLCSVLLRPPSAASRDVCAAWAASLELKSANSLASTAAVMAHLLLLQPLLLMPVAPGAGVAVVVDALVQLIGAAGDEGASSAALCA